MTQSNTDWVRLASGTQGEPTEEHPEAEVRHVVRGIVRQGLKPLPAKASVSLRIDQDVLEWFKAQGAGYQTRINSVLKAFRDASVNP
ncbi:BrnA antitoxin family protein [Thiothrix subterranea]|uniref:BrnA antitoxin family protein n=1 Tax=Thiothrix subterranea TaxID=2735563 RepID=A0AA51R302_9GAMM|nr:BrnA antitoxin family protein [Thiothrix subterranea]MDQ5770425.1 BrnA antitoxin family protein [Thiothrix subterranea]WML85131.1 BrnA antitoxin family protein [Thiothrix subterranea]